MKELTKLEEKHYFKWNRYKKNKFQYVFLHGIIYWGLPMGMLSFIINCHFRPENMNLSLFLNSMALWGTGGLFFALNQYKGLAEMNLYYNEDELISKGVKIVDAGKVWNYENLIITKQDAETLIVSNKLFWFEESYLSAKNLNDLVDTVKLDFDRLKTNPDFDSFSSKYKVKIQVYNNLDKSIPLIEIVI